MTEAPETDAAEWPREIWAAERGEHDQTGEHVFSEHATVSRFCGDAEREREFHRYVDADIFDSQVRYHQAVLANMRAEIAAQADALTAAQERIEALEAVLHFYANETAWDTPPPTRTREGHDALTFQGCPAVWDAGERARAVLATQEDREEG